MTTTIIANDRTLTTTTSAFSSFDVEAGGRRQCISFARPCTALHAWLTDHDAQARMRTELADALGVPHWLMPRVNALHRHFIQPDYSFPSLGDYIAAVRTALLEVQLLEVQQSSSCD
jgi:hypothetical protein